jgi:Family of unknown function (DUF5677)
MTDEHDSQELPAVERVEVSEEALAEFTTEDDFNGIAVRLMVEYGSWVCIAASLLPGKTRKWTRNQAIIGGLLVRSYKLTSALLDQTCQRRREITLVLGRLAYECMINVLYLVEHGSAELFQAYVVDALRHERKLRDRIMTNIAGRSGIALPIEERMLQSIDKTFAVSALKPEDVTKQAAKPWKQLDLFQRANKVGLGEIYLGFFGGPSHHVHGSWFDLLEYHLSDDGDGFTPELAWHPPRPQVLLSLCKVGIDMLQTYLQHFAGDGAEPVLEDLDDLRERIRLVSVAHERYLSARQLKPD